MKYPTYKQVALVLGFCLILMMGIASCGSDDTPTPEPTIAPTTAPTAAPTDTATPPPATATTAVTNTQPLTNTTETTQTTSANAASQPQSPLAAPQSPLAAPQSPLPTPTKSAVAAPATGEGVMVEKILSGTATITEVTSSKDNGQIVVLSGADTISAVAKETKAQTPESGKASISGVLYQFTTDNSSSRVMPGNLFYLTPAVVDGDKVHSPVGYHGPQTDKGDVKGTSNLKGQVFLNNVPPGKYYLVIQKQPYDWYLGFESEKAPIPQLITLKAGDKLDLGLVYVRGE